MDVFNPREVRQVTFATGQQESNRQRGGRICLRTTLMNKSHSVRTPAILDEPKDSGIDRGEGVALLDRIGHAFRLLGIEPLTLPGDVGNAPTVGRTGLAAFLTPPHNWGSEIRCFLRDPDGHLVEISESVPT
jgi:catechol 2,3-dioxygenase-like lactoylglutathione lyase family enzyme